MVDGCPQCPAKQVPRNLVLKCPVSTSTEHVLHVRHDAPQDYDGTPEVAELDINWGQPWIRSGIICCVPLSVTRLRAVPLSVIVTEIE